MKFIKSLIVDLAWYSLIAAVSLYSAGCNSFGGGIKFPTEEDRKAQYERYEAEARAGELRFNETMARREQEFLESTGARYIEKHPDTPDEFKPAILAGKLVVGMRQREASAAIGIILPQSISEGLGGKSELWKSTENPARYLYFRDGRLIRWDTY